MNDALTHGAIWPILFQKRHLHRFIKHLPN